MLKFLKGSTLNQAHVLAVLGNIGTAVATFVPAWSHEEQIIVAALGGIVSNVYPLVAAVERAIGVAREGHSVSLAAVASQAEAAVKAEVSKVDFNSLVADAENAHGVTLAAVEAAAEAKVRQVLAGLTAPAPAPVVAPVVQVVPDPPPAAA